MISIFSWGANDMGQLLSNDFEDYLAPNILKIDIDLFKIQRIICGNNITYVLLNNGEIYVGGSNIHGQLGLMGKDKYPSLTKLSFCVQYVKSVVTGWDFTVILLNDGTIYSSGSNTHGQLGFDPEKIPIISQFTKLNEVPQMKHVSAGMWHCAAVSYTDDVWVWGYNNRMQLGISSRSRSPVCPQILPNSNTKHIKFIISGAFHSGFLTENDQMYMWGDNQYGQCGQTIDVAQIDKSRYLTIREIKFEIEDVIQLESGWSHCVALNSQGYCYSWGSNRYCQLGREISQSSNYDPIPRQVIFPNGVEKISELSVGSQHNLTVSSDQKTLFSWGWNDHGMLGVGDQIDKNYPVVLKGICSKAKENHEIDIRLISHGSAAHNFCVVETK